MEIAFAALASLGTEIGIAGPTALAGTTAAGAAIPVSTGSLLLPGASLGIGAGLSSPILSVLSGASSAVSVMQQLRSGEMTAENYELKAAEARAESAGAEAEHRTRARNIKRELLATLGENDVAFAGSGIDLSYGIAADRRAGDTKDAYGEIEVDRATTDAQRAMYDLRDRAYRRFARTSRSGAGLGALATTLSAAGKLAYRG